MEKKIKKCDVDRERAKALYEETIKSIKKHEDALSSSLDEFRLLKEDCHNPIKFIEDAHNHPITHKYASAYSVVAMMDRRNGNTGALPDLDVRNNRTRSYDDLCTTAREVFGITSVTDIWEMTEQKKEVLEKVLWLLKLYKWNHLDEFKAFIGEIKSRSPQMLPESFQCGRIYYNQQKDLKVQKLLIALYLQLENFEEKLGKHWTLLRDYPS